MHVFWGSPVKVTSRGIGDGGTKADWGTHTIARYWWSYYWSTTYDWSTAWLNSFSGLWHVPALHASAQLCRAQAQAGHHDCQMQCDQGYSEFSHALFIFFPTTWMQCKWIISYACTHEGIGRPNVCVDVFYSPFFVFYCIIMSMMMQHYLSTRFLFTCMLLRVAACACMHYLLPPDESSTVRGFGRWNGFCGSIGAWPVRVSPRPRNQEGLWAISSKHPCAYPYIRLGYLDI